MDNKYLDNPILNEALEDYFDELENYNEGIKDFFSSLNQNAKLKESKRLDKFLQKCAKKIKTKTKYKYYCLLETKTTRTSSVTVGNVTTYRDYPVINYSLYGSNVQPFKKELLNKKVIHVKMWQKELEAKKFIWLSFDSMYLIKLDKSQFPDELKKMSNLNVIYHDTNIFSDDYMKLK